MKTIFPKKEDIQDNWVLIDGSNQVLGRLASHIASILRGKNTAKFTPHLPGENGVILINASKIIVTGKKNTDKIYYHHTRYPGGVKSINFKDAMEKKPDFPIKNAVKGMLPKNRLGRHLLTRFKVYADENHPHQAQQPVKIDL